MIAVAGGACVFFWMLSLSLKYEIDNAAYPPVFIPEHVDLGNYRRGLRAKPLSALLLEQPDVTGAATLVALLVGVPAGYGIARLRAHKAAVVLLIARMTPGLSYLIPLFTLFQWLGLIGTLWPHDHHPPRDHAADRGLDHDRLFRDPAEELEEAARDRRRHAAGRCSATSRCRSPGPASWSRILAFIFSWNNFIFGACSPAARRAPCRSPSTTC